MKKIIIIILTILSVISCGLIGWYSWILLDAPEKIISQTFEVGEQVIFKSDGSTEKKHFIDVNLYNNVFEIKFNYMLDETQTAFYSQGLQFVLKDDKETFNLNGTYSKLRYQSDRKAKDKDLISWGCFEEVFHYNKIFSNKVYSNVDKFNYMSGDDYKTTLISSNPINDDTLFKIQLGEDLYGMKFKGLNIVERDFNSKYDFISDDFYIGSTETFLGGKNHVFVSYLQYQNDYNYSSCDIDYFAQLIYKAVSESLNAGTSQTCIFEFGDLFDYYYYDESKQQYINKVVDDSLLSKISKDVKSYYCIGVNIHDSDMTSSSQSLFNSYKGNSNYNVELSFDDYFIGRTLVSLDVNKFDFIESETSGAYYLSLNNDFRDFYKDYKHLVEFDISIDLDYLDSLGIEFLGIIEDSLEDYKIYNSETIKLVNGNIVKGVVNYV